MTPEAKIALAIKVLEQSHWNLGEITDGNDDLDLKKWNDLMYDALTALRSAEPQASERPERPMSESGQEDDEVIQGFSDYADELENYCTRLEAQLVDAKSLIDDVAMLCKAQGISFQVFNCRDAGGPKP